jgi:hypothetical protein
MTEVTQDIDLQRIVCVLETLGNRQLVEQGLRPPDALPSEPVSEECRRLTQHELVVFMSAADWAL